MARSSHRHPTTMAPCNGTTSTPKVGRHPPPNHSTLQWHPAMAPRPLPQSWSPSSPTHSTLQWHPAMAPSNGTTPTPPKLVVTLPSNGTLQWHHVHSPEVGRHPPRNHSTLPWRPTMGPSNGTTSTAPCNSRCHVQSAKMVRRHPPPIGSKNPYSYRYLGNKVFEFFNLRHFQSSCGESASIYHFSVYFYEAWKHRGWDDLRLPEPFGFARSS